MGTVVSIDQFRRSPTLAERKARMEALAKFEQGDRWATRHSPHSPMHTSPLMQPGRDAGSIADVSPATDRLRNCILDLVGFAKAGGPPLPDGAG